MKWNDPKAKEKYIDLCHQAGVTNDIGIERMWAARPKYMDNKEIDEAWIIELTKSFADYMNSDK